MQTNSWWSLIADPRHHK